MDKHDSTMIDDQNMNDDVYMNYTEEELENMSDEEFNRIETEMILRTYKTTAPVPKDTLIPFAQYKLTEVLSLRYDQDKKTTITRY